MAAQDYIDAIDPSKPQDFDEVAGTIPTISSVRNNFTSIKQAIQAVLDLVSGLSAPSLSSMLLTGIDFASSALIVATDNALVALGKLQAQISLRATIDSPAFTGVPQAPTAASGTNSTQLSTTAFVNQAIDYGAQHAALSDFVDPGTTGGVDNTLTVVQAIQNLWGNYVDSLGYFLPAGASTIKYLTGDPFGAAAWVTLSTLRVPEYPGGGQYFTQARVLATPLTGLSFATSTAITASDTVLIANGKLQAQLTAQKMPAGGTANQVLSKIDGTNYNTQWVTLSGGGALTNWTDYFSNSAPNATVTVSGLIATGVAVNIDAVISSKGTGSILAQSPDGTSTRGNKRGTNCVDLQVTRTDPTKVCGGNNCSILGGTENYIASGTDYSAICTGSSHSIWSGAYGVFIGGGYQNQCYAGWCTVVGGMSNIVQGLYSFIGGGHNNIVGSIGQGGVVCGGEYNQVNAVAGSIVGGLGAVVTINGQQSYSGASYLVNPGDSQVGLLVLKALTTNATTTTLTCSNSGGLAVNQITCQNQQAITFFGTVTAKQKGSTNCASWKVEGHLVRGANAASTVLRYQLVSQLFNSSTWTVAIVVDTTNGGCKINFTGAGGVNVAVVANIYTSEATYV